MRVLEISIAIVLAVVALTVRPAAAEEPALVAADAYDIHQALCAEVAGGTTSAAAESIAEVTEVWQEVIAAYEASGRSYLLYWRGVLGECLGQGERAASDLRLFVELEQFGSEDVLPLVQDARTRLRRMGVSVDRPSDEELAEAKAKAEAGGEFSAAAESAGLRRARRSARVPFFLVGAGGGYQRTGAYNYGAFSADLSFGLIGPLRVEATVRGGVSVSYTNDDGETEATGRYLLMAIGVGPALEFAGPVRPRVGVHLQIAPNPSLVGGGAVLVGFVASGGVDVPLGRSGVAVRPVFDIGTLGTMFTVRGMVQLVVGVDLKRKTK